MKIEGCYIYYKYGVSLDNMTGLLLIDTESNSFTNLRNPDNTQLLINNFHSFANRVLHLCINGDIREKVSREIG